MGNWVLCDDGEIIEGDLIRQSHNKIFVHFNTNHRHYDEHKKCDWIQVPNDRICPPPKNPPKRARNDINSIHRYLHLIHIICTNITIHCPHCYRIDLIMD
eukprot:TRINITY_DN6998_c0_g1_i1.p1 TRINITY_DN6998_c0_g1~~TRINITY_DN6998_c0_g1_i1.p1  ORF type:complete len:108 (+),score=15.27 TRINITY_DN6998_c0_g1_i1:26-325(+)